MASVTFFPVRARTKEVDIVGGRWAGGGAATNCTRVSGRGIASVAYVSQGKYLITLEKKFPYIHSVHIQPLTALTLGATVALTAISTSAGTIAFSFFDVTGAALKDILTTEELHITILGINSTVQP